MWYLEKLTSRSEYESFLQSLHKNICASFSHVTCCPDKTARNSRLQSTHKEDLAYRQTSLHVSACKRQRRTFLRALAIDFRVIRPQLPDN